MPQRIGTYFDGAGEESDLMKAVNSIPAYIEVGWLPAARWYVKILRLISILTTRPPHAHPSPNAAMLALLLSVPNRATLRQVRYHL